MRARFVAAIALLVTFVLFLLLGRAVSTVPDPLWLMPFEASWVNHSTLVAWWLTWCCYVDVLVPVAIVLIVLAVRFPHWRARIVFSLLSLLLAWRLADHFQHLFERARRLDWVVKHELAFSYPSSHAAIVTAFYWLWALLLARSGFRYKSVASTVVALLGLAIIWSRLALGAHYLTDLVGGILLGVAIVGAIAVVWPTNVFERQRTGALE
jgi:membrane-associated phospholipid phosphatase